MVSYRLRRGYEARKGKQLAQAAAGLHQQTPDTHSEQESIDFPRLEDGLAGEIWQLLGAGITHTIPR